MTVSSIIQGGRALPMLPSPEQRYRLGVAFSLCLLSCRLFLSPRTTTFSHYLPRVVTGGLLQNIFWFLARFSVYRQLILFNIVPHNRISLCRIASLNLNNDRSFLPRFVNYVKCFSGYINCCIRAALILSISRVRCPCCQEQRSDTSEK